MSTPEKLSDMIRTGGLVFPETYTMSWYDADGERHGASFEAESLEELKAKVDEHGPEMESPFRAAQLVRGPEAPPPEETP